MSADIQWLKSGTTNSNNFFFVSYLIGFLFYFHFGQEREHQSYRHIYPFLQHLSFLPEEVSSLSHKDKALRTHPPHKSLCSQRFLNTFAKIAAKIVQIEQNTKEKTLFLFINEIYANNH